MKTRFFIALLVLTLASCAPAATPAPTGTALPPTATFTPIPATPTPTFTPGFTPPPPTPLPPTPTFPPMITPDAVQVERWKEYQTELAKFVLSDSGTESPYYEVALCEWDILGQSGQEVYVWAMCYAPGVAGGRTPAVIYLEANGSIQKVKVPGLGSAMETNIQKMFPTDVREKIASYFSSLATGRANDLRLHLQYRLVHPEVPPLIIPSASPTATPTP